MKRFKGVKGTIILIIMIALIAGYYFYLSNRELPVKETIETTAVQNALLRDLEQSYPPSPKEVVKYYFEITKCFYNETYTEDELRLLALKIRELYDAELVANQTEEEYLISIQTDINTFKEKNYTISSYATAASTDVEYYSVDGYEFAKLNCAVTIREGTTLQPTNERFLLRKDEDGHWKIYGWDLAEITTPNE
ncbi:MAG: DUF6715 family protein [Lachnospiraceae bacterium]